MREVCLDIETTGLDPRNGDKIIEIAAIEMIDKVRTGKFFHSYVNPRRDVPQEAFAIHGISTEFLQDKPIFNHVVYKFLDFIRGAKIVIHNAAFDTKFINYELGSLGIDKLDMSNVIDSLQIARAKFPGSPASLDALCKRFGIDLSKRTKHGALLDTELLCDVYVELMGGAQSGMVFDSEKKSQNVENISQETVLLQNKKILPKRDFALSQEELQLHQEFITKNFKSNLWGY
jgi:DNA polymerase III subunit epsilon